MRNQNDNDIGTSGFSSARKPSDTLSVRELAHYLRQVEMARFFGQIARMLIKPFVGWNRRMTLSRDLNAMPDYLLRDIGIRREQIPALVVGELRRGSLSLSPTGNQSAPAFYKDTDGTPLAA